MHSMRMDGMSSESMEMNDGDMQDVVVDDTELSPRSSSTMQPDLDLEELIPTNKLELPIETCTHCMSDSGLRNAPI